MAAGAVALAFVAGTASAQLEYYALTSDGTLSYVNNGVQSVVGNTGIGNTANSLALNWQSRGGDGNFWASEGTQDFINPWGITTTLDENTGASTGNKYNLSDDLGFGQLGGGIAFDTDGSVWQASASFAGGTKLAHHAADGTFISSVDVAISGTVGALYMRADGAAVIGGNDGKIYTVNKNTGQIANINVTSLENLSEFSTGARVSDGFFGGPFQVNHIDAAYAVTNDGGGVASIWRLNVYNGGFSLVDTFDTTGLGNVWGLQVVPSPASAALLGLGGLAATRRRRS
jgi:hypothetical protein